MEELTGVSYCPICRNKTNYRVGVNRQECIVCGETYFQRDSKSREEWRRWLQERRDVVRKKGIKIRGRLGEEE